MDLDSLMLPRDQIWEFVPNHPNTTDDADELLFFEDCLIPKGKCFRYYHAGSMWHYCELLPELSKSNKILSGYSICSFSDLILDAIGFEDTLVSDILESSAELLEFDPELITEAADMEGKSYIWSKLIWIWK